MLGKHQQLVVEIPDSAVRSTPEFRELVTRLRDSQLELAYDGYASGQAQITEHKEIAPDFLKFEPSLFKSIHWSKDRQRQVQLIVRASRDIGSAVIATGIDSDADMKVCLDLGCTFAQGTLFGNPQPGSAPNPRPRSMAVRGSLEHS